MAASLALLAAPSAFAQNFDPNSPGVLEPVMTALDAVEREIPHTDQADGGEFRFKPIAGCMLIRPANYS